MAGVLWHVTASLQKKDKQDPFEPFRITISPKWYFILKDYKLIDDDGWDPLQNAPPIPGFRVLHQDIVITRLTPSITYFDNYHSFRTTLAFDEKLEELVPESKRDLYTFYQPRFYIKSKLEEHPKYGHLRSIEFGLKTDDSMKRSYDGSDDRGDIPFAKLPDAIFNDFYADQNFTLNFKLDPDKVLELLSTYGWEKEKRHLESSATWTTLEHKYLTVYYDGI